MYEPKLIELGSPPCIKASKIGLISRDYNEGDFSNCFKEILNLLDKEGCDTALFSLYTILEENKNNVLECMNNLRLGNIKNIFVEYYKEECKFNEKTKLYEKVRTAYDTVHVQEGVNFINYSYKQVFGRIYEKPKHIINQYVENFAKERIMGNVATILCGETNIVKLYRKKEGVEEHIEDDYGFRKIAPKTIIFLNPIHDYMTRYEMKKKRKFLSQGNRWVLSVWNRGKKAKTGKPLESKNSPWTVFHNEEEIIVERIELPPHLCNHQKIEIGIIDTTRKGKGPNGTGR